LKTKTIMKLYYRYCTSLTMVSFMASLCDVIIIKIYVMGVDV